ncbi:MAG: GvpL/GvpF family gas vesicle protein [Candidatus Rokubacteria bacterium]|nr:GvpL/GvpF family gas vesicle protein [Candidatus Rokubacteria bacterium]
MTTRASTKAKLYLYAIVSGPNGQSFGPIGLDGGRVHAVAHGRLAAVVSEVPPRLRPERRQLAAHQEVLRRLMRDETAVLPVSFGVVADGPAAITKILSRNQQAFLEQIRHVAGRVEMGLRVAWDVPNIFEYFVQTHPELRAVRDRFFGGHRELTQDDRIEVGRVFERLLMEDREAHTREIEAILTPHCAAIKRNNARHEHEVANLACLVGRDAQERFEAAVFEAAKLFDNSYAFDYNGPWAPHNFVELTLEL